MVTKRFLSGSTNGRGIKLVATATPGTLLHTATNTGTEKDELYVYLQNNHTADVLVTIEFGGVADPDDRIISTVPAKSGLVLAVPGLPLAGGLEVKAFAAVANVVMAHGFVHRVAE